MNEVKVDVSGTVVSDPVLRKTRAGDPFVSFRIAVNPRRWNAEDGSWSDGEAQFFSVTAFRALAGNAYHSLTKGQHVMVTGRLRLTQYEARDGELRTSAQIDAHDIGPSLKFGQSTFTKSVRPVNPSNDRLADDAVTLAMRELEGDLAPDEGDSDARQDAVTEGKEVGAANMNGQADTGDAATEQGERLAS